jgi:hypothetical protein
MVTCTFCDIDFTQNYNLTKHLKYDKCEVARKMSPLDYHNKTVKKIQELQHQISITGDSNNINSNNTTINLNVEIKIQPIQKLSLDYVTTEDMKTLIEKYDNDLSQSSLNSLVGTYLKNILCNTDHPENHAIKYVKKYPPTFNSVHEDSEGNIINTINNLKNTTELLTDPVLDLLKVKLKQFIRKYQKDDDPEFDYECYEDAIGELRKELNKHNVKKVLNNFLQGDLLNNIEMKLNIK